MKPSLTKGVAHPRRWCGIAAVSMGGVTATLAAAPGAPPGMEEFGLDARQLVQSVERVEAGIAKCMRAHGFEYVAVDYDTVRKGMSADKSLGNVSEEEFIDKHGFGISTLYTGRPPQMETGYSPARVGLGERNVATFKKLSPPAQVAYGRALLGPNRDATFAVGLEQENFSRTGGCTRQAIEQVFSPEQLAASYYNPKHALINKDPRMKAALRKYAERMRKSGYDYAHPDDVEADIHKRLDALTRGEATLVENFSAEQRAALSSLQDYERRVARRSRELQEKLLDPVEEQIAREMFARADK